jgi:hypothetical protein
MRKTILYIFCFLIFTIITCSGFYIVDKSFNSMIKPNGDFNMVNYKINNDNYVECEVMNEYFEFNIKTFNLITNVEEVFKKNK